VPILVAPLAPEVPSVSLAELTDVTWTGGDGSVVQLTDWSSLVTGTMVTPGVSGHLMPTWDVYSDRSPSYDGENVRGVRANARDVIIPLHMWGQDRGECKARFQALVAALNPQLGQGTLTGPCSSITLTNATTGKSLVIAQALTSSDTAVIDFREGAKTALMNGVTNLYSAISITSSAFWSLKPGLNNITITLPGAAGTTTARMDYKPRYLAAW
jgi:hypothetical protein